MASTYIVYPAEQLNNVQFDGVWAISANSFNEATDKAISLFSIDGNYWIGKFSDDSPTKFGVAIDSEPETVYGAWVAESSGTEFLPTWVADNKKTWQYVIYPEGADITDAALDEAYIVVDSSRDRAARRAINLFSLVGNYWIGKFSVEPRQFGSTLTSAARVTYGSWPV